MKITSFFNLGNDLTKNATEQIKTRIPEMRKSGNPMYLEETHEKFSYFVQKNRKFPELDRTGPEYDNENQNNRILD